MEIPGHGLVTGQWDLRGGVDDYLGKVAFAGQRVLEIGPASGFLTFEMEKRGAEGRLCRSNSRAPPGILCRIRLKNWKKRSARTSGCNG